MKTMWITSTLLSAAALAGCGGSEVRNAYEGADRADSEVAILFTPKEGVYSDKRRRALFSAIDGKPVGTYMDGYPTATRVLPGTYMLKVKCLDPQLQSHQNSGRWDSFLLFRATVQAGHFYELACDFINASAIDRGTRYESVKDLLPPAAVEKLRR